MVQNKTGTVSYKNHKQIAKPESDWIFVGNEWTDMYDRMAKEADE